VAIPRLHPLFADERVMGTTGAQVAHKSLVEVPLGTVAARKGALAAMPAHDWAVESRKASGRAKVEHPFLIVKRDFGFTKTRYRGLAKNRHHLHMLFASANWLMRARAVALTG
jgi:IS5 family transposase